MSKGNCDGIGVGIFCLRLIQLQTGWHDTTLHMKIVPTFHGIKKESLDASLVQHDLLVAADVRDCVRNSVTSPEDSFFVRIPETDLKHVVGFDPRPVAKIERVKNFKCPTLQPICLAVEDLANREYRECVMELHLLLCLAYRQFWS